MRAAGFVAAVPLIVVPFSAMGQGLAGGSMVPRSAFFLGIGGSMNSLDIDQDIGGDATSEIFDGGRMIATGEAGGPAASFSTSETAFAPALQAGYFSRFDGTGDWLWGGKVSYQYMNADLSISRANVPQVGTYTTTGADPATTPFIGNVVIGSSRTTVEHQMLFMAFVGRAFERSYVYAGAGPALFRARLDINNAVGFANIKGLPTDITGAPVDFSGSKWVWGGAGQVGMNYYLDDAWSIDVNYTFARSASYDMNFTEGFSNPNNGTQGLAHLDTSQRLTSQSFAVTINKAF